MREDLREQVEREFAERRARNEEMERSRREEIRIRYPDLFTLTKKREELIFGSLRGILNGQPAAEDLPARMERVSQQIRKTLLEHGYPENYLAPVRTCAVCGDTGYVGEPVRRMCECMKKAYQNRLREAIGLPADSMETFENYQEARFSDQPLPNRTYSQRQLNAVIRNACEKWADTWPAQQPRDLLLTGPSGTGKTWFLHAMAARLIERDCSVLLISAYAFLEIARDSYFERDGGLEELIETPVLMIDDLGSEPLMKNITVEQLFRLINERQLRNLATAVSTNLSIQELRERYTERIISRLTDPRTSNVLRLDGQDLRTGRG